ncbi:MAG: hypothetical protein M1831_002531 [Alyxoria varia]|nr:MAG: hypothetical protein M1831_002531 [Alyxoria varia]
MKGSDGPEGGDYLDLVGVKDPRSLYIQIAVSCVLGLGAFLAFCILRPRWKGLYNARKQQRDQASPLPELPDTLFGWIPALWRVTEQQVLASAGLDAYVFLRFFKLAIKFLSVTLFFALAVFKPVHDAFPEPSSNSTATVAPTSHDNTIPLMVSHNDMESMKGGGISDNISTDYLWMYLVFAYLLSGLAIYLMVTETERIIDVRQEYLGNQSTITDRTIRLSGIPPALRSEEKIKQFIEDLEIGNVDSVMLCKNWEELDNLVDDRMSILRKLEGAWAVYVKRDGKKDARPDISDPSTEAAETGDGEPQDEESGALLSSSQRDEPDDLSSQQRPKATIRFGVLKLRSRYVDAIDYYEEKLRRIDEKIQELRKQHFEPTALAFVTMDTAAACQMAVQAVLDPSPMHLIAKRAPAPADIVWRNTYLPRSSRMLKGWSITVVITILTVFWSLLLVPIAFTLNEDSIKKVLPGLAAALESNVFLASLVMTQLPTLASTLLFVAVPYLYDWLANLQGIMSQGDIELSVISKNFFFAFFNYFVVFSVLGTASNFYSFFQHFQDSLKDTTWVANQLAKSLQGLLPFYTNLIVLQGIGLFPFRLLEFGSVALYPIYKLWARTPRDYAELVEPPTFNYGFYLPQMILIFIICIVYSVLRESWKVLLSGLIFFLIGSFVYKYQLLYAMDHRQYSTGKAWTMICRRTIVGLILFQLTTAGQLALTTAFKRSLAIAPLIIGTIWFSYAYSRNYDPLMKFIALRSIERKAPSLGDEEIDPDGWGETARLRYEAESHAANANEASDRGKRFVNPSLVASLQKPWLADSADEDEDVPRPSTPRRRLTTALNALHVLWNRMERSMREHSDKQLHPYHPQPSSQTPKDINNNAISTAKSTEPAFFAASSTESFQIMNVNGGSISKAERVSDILASSLAKKQYYNLRLVCRYWDMQITAAAPPKFPAIYKLPVELLQDVYWYLSPTDFAAARNSCHNWRYASMDMHVLSTMLKRGGWWSGAEAEAQKRGNEVLNAPGAFLEAFLSSRLAEEVALLPDARTCEPAKQEDSLPLSRDQNDKNPASNMHAIPKTSITDISELGTVPVGKDCDHGCGLTFTISACGRFLLVAETNNILVYELGNPRLVPVTSIVCPRRVLATSMDTSAQRFAVAALLDERMGLVCDLDLDEVHREPPAPEVYTDASLRVPRTRGSTEEHEVNDEDESLPLKRRDILAVAGQKRRLSAPDANDQGRVNSIHIRSPNQSVSLMNASHRHANQEWNDRVVPFAGLDPMKYINPTPIANQAAGSTQPIYNSRSGGITNRTLQRVSSAIPISPAALSIYNSVCSPDDPPRSVAICPSRRCVAFGCEAGVELHWVDARGGRNLMKWFPLSAPSECLYFLPPRPGGVDGPNKLRLISSKVGPGQRERSNACRNSARQSTGWRRRRLWNLWPWMLDSNHSTSQPLYSSNSPDSDFRDDIGNEYDHYSAVPLSDGVHLLFTDPKTGNLVLGSDAPLGGSTKLLRKVKFVPPGLVIEQYGTTSAGSKPGKEGLVMPNDYAIGMDLTQGVRIVAVYGTDKIVLYNVPPDVFTDVSRVGGNGVVAGHEEGDEWSFGEWAWWLDDGRRNPGQPASRAERPSSASDGAATSALPFSGRYPIEQDHVDGEHTGDVWPVIIKGTLLATVPSVVEVGIQNEGSVREGGIAVWAFTKDAVAHTWRSGCCGERHCSRNASGHAKIGRGISPGSEYAKSGKSPSPSAEIHDSYPPAQTSCLVHRVVERNGLVVDVMERHGDWVIRDIWGNDPILERPSQREQGAVRVVGDRDSSDDDNDESRTYDGANGRFSMDVDDDARMGGVDGAEEEYDYPCIAPKLLPRCLRPRPGVEDAITPETFDVEILNSTKTSYPLVLAANGLFEPDTHSGQDTYMSEAPTFATVDHHCQTIICDAAAARRVREQGSQAVDANGLRSELCKVMNKIRRLKLRSSDETMMNVDPVNSTSPPPASGISRSRMQKGQWDRYGSLRRAAPGRAMPTTFMEEQRKLEMSRPHFAVPRPPPSTPAGTMRALPACGQPTSTATSVLCKQTATGASVLCKRKKDRSSSAGGMRPVSQRPKLIPASPKKNLRRPKHVRFAGDVERVVSAPIMSTTSIYTTTRWGLQDGGKKATEWWAQRSLSIAFGVSGDGQSWFGVERCVERRCVSACA